MEIRDLAIPHAYEIIPRQHGDSRGLFLEWFRNDKLEERIGHSLNLKQGNTSVSSRGTVRGIHFADVPPSQAKYVTVMVGTVLDFVVDIRVGSPTFGEWDSVLLDDVDRKAIYIPEGLGHCFVALTPHATVSYLVTETFNIDREHGINPLDPDLNLDFGLSREELLLSEKDVAAPHLVDALATGILPTWEEACSFYSQLKEVR